MPLSSRRQLIRHTGTALLGIGIVLGVMVGIAGCAVSTTPVAQAVVHVPGDASLDEAGALVADGGMVLISSGTYHGTLAVSANDVTVRGEDRNKVILDGEFTLSNGVVGTGERVTVENLTVRNYLQNGVLITGVTDENGAGVARGPDGYLPDAAPDPVPGYLVQKVTAQNNGLYGIYAFNRTGGVIRSNLASGGSDSGIYVGQCADCNALVTENIMQWNAVGLELANASNVVITGNRIVENRIGVSVLSNYLEAHGPTRGVRIVGNVVANNVEERTPTQASGAFGIGIGLGGTVAAEIRANRIIGNANVGVWVTSSEDFAPLENRVAENAWGDNGLDVAFTPTAHAVGGSNCFQLGEGATSEPSALMFDGCAAQVIEPGVYSQPAAPAGVSFAEVGLPPGQPGLDAVDEKPRSLSNSIQLPNTNDITVPGPELLAGSS